MLVIYDKCSGLIHKIVESIGGGETLENLKMDSNIFDYINVSNIEINPFIDGVLLDRDGNFVAIAPLEEIFKKKAIDCEKKYNKVGWVTTWNEKCGIAKYSEHVLKNYLSNYIVLANNTTELIRQDNYNVIRCWDKAQANLDSLLLEIKENSIDCVVFQYASGFFNTDALVVLVEKLKTLGIKTVLTLHIVDDFSIKAIEFFDDVVVLNQKALEKLNNKAKLIPLPCYDININHGLIYSLKNRNNKRLKIASFGFMLPHKGFDNLIKALNYMKNIKNIDCELSLYSSIHTPNKQHSENYLKYLYDLIKLFNLKDNVKINTNFLNDEDVIKELNKADCIVMPYKHSADQSDSAAINMALSSKKPVICSNIGIFSGREAIYELPDKTLNENGIVLKYQYSEDDTIAIYYAIHTLLVSDKKEIYGKLINNSVSYIKRVSNDNISREYTSITKSLANNKILFVGPTRTFFSFAMLNRNIMLAMDELGADVTAVDDDPDKGFVSSKRLVELINKDKFIKNDRVAILNTFPPLFEYEAKKKVLILPWETSIAPRDWCKEINKSIDCFFTISDWCKESFIRGGVKKDINVFKCGINHNVYNNNVKKVNLNKYLDNDYINDDTFIFLHLGHAQDRKGSDLLFEAYLNEFSNDENVILLYKAHDGCLFNLVLDNISLKHSKPINRQPKYLFVYDNVTEEENAGFIKASNIVVHPCRAEGFGLPIVESAACGVPSIVTNIGGPSEFVNNDNGWLIDSKLVPSKYHIEVKGSKWANPDKEHLQYLMRYAYSHRNEVKIKGEQAIKDAQKYTWQNSAWTILKKVNEL